MTMIHLSDFEYGYFRTKTLCETSNIVNRMEILGIDSNGLSGIIERIKWN